MDSINKVKRMKSFLYGLSIIIFPVMLFIGFFMHPDITSFKIMTTAEELAKNFRHNNFYHIGHLIVALAIPLMIFNFICFIERLKGSGIWFGLLGGIIGIFGSVVLALDKGSLCLVLSAFDTLMDDKFREFIPFLQVIVDKDGLLGITLLLPLLPLGGIIQTIGLLREKMVKLWQGFAIISGLLLLNNPDIEILSIIGTSLMIMGYLPLGIKIMKMEEFSAGMQFE